MPNRNYVNLLDLPILFYVVCILFFVAGSTTALAINPACIYLALRVIHSIIHSSDNNMMHRLTAFASSNVVLILLWFIAARQMIAA